ncbi:Type I restriction-modification system, specificity subunit S [Vibrio harveyi]|uniref:restriction endonuclease subunit S n=1 Tax=Vibrio harveyi TaxID=669 RepID=UPI0028957AC4|nr:Type I restriction-modification system, specificity subunit S [Vibrio harveyi]CAH1550682.1 Type I restriction-modification system, specificity subunit S [Vibrio harveyi]CAH1583268.1 Type I restriction-modification system, specificity subunit S [Vibrio harveyi]
MTSNYKRIGDYIRLVDVRNKDLAVDTLLGLSISKEFIPSVANTVGTNMANYKIINKGQFACSLMQVRRDKKIPVALQTDFDKAIISQAYPVFEVIDSESLDPEYLMMWMSRAEFDRHACFLAVGGVRGSLEWDDFCDMELPVPSIEKQREIVREYNVVNDRIALNEQLTQKLEDTAQAIYKQWFVDFSIPDESVVLAETKNIDFPQVPKGWALKRIDELTSKIGSGSTPRGGKGAYKSQGISLIRSMNVHDYQFVYEDLAFIDDVQAKKLANVEIEPRDVLINITGVSVARCCVVPNSVIPARVNQHVMIIRPNLEMSYYLQCALASSSYKSRLLGTSEGASTRQALTKADIEEFLVLVPSEGVLAKFEGIAEVIFSKIEALAQTSQKLKELRSVILSKLATS